MIQEPTKLTVEFPEEDVDRLMKAMYYASEQLKIDIGKAMRMAVATLLGSLAASTRVSPQYREITERPNFASGFADHYMQRNRSAYAVTGWFGKPNKTYQSKLVYSKDFETAKRRYALIARRGLAKRSWQIVGKIINQNVNSVSMPTLGAAITTKIAMENVDARASYEGAEVFAEIHNMLNYINEAMIGGPKDVSTAFERASSKLEFNVNRKVEERINNI